MYNESLNDSKIIHEIRDLVNDIDSVKDDIDSYCQFLKEMFLSGSGRN